MTNPQKVSSKLIERQIADKREQEVRQNRERITFVAIVTFCMFALYLVLSSKQGGSAKPEEVSRGNTHIPSPRKTAN